MWASPGTFTLESNSSTYSATGSDIQIGFTPATGQSFQPLLSVNGTVSYNDSDISIIDGTVTAAIGNLTLPLFSGSLEIPIGTPSDSDADSAPGTLQDSDPDQSEEIAGCPIDIKSLSLILNGGSPEIEVQGSISLPSPLNTSIDGDLLITAQGIEVESGSISFPEIDFDLGGLYIDAKDMSVSYVSSASGNEFLIQGDVTLADMLAGTTVNADLAGDTDGIANGITVQGTTVNLAGTLSLSGLTLPGGWGLQDASLTFNTADLDYSGSAQLSIPGVFTLGATFSLIDGQLDSLGISLSNLGDTVPLGDTGCFLDGASGSVDNLVPGNGPITFSGSLDFSFGPDETISLPDWLGGADIHTDLADLDLSGSISTSQLSGSGTLTVADGLVTGSVNASFNFGTQVFSANGTLSVLDGLFSGNSTLTVNNDDMIFSGSGDVSLPLNKIEGWLPNIGPIAGGNLYVNLVPSNLADDYLDVWSSVSVLGLSGTAGIRVNFNGSLPSILNAQNVPQIDPPASATFAITSGTPWVLLNAQWANSNSNVPFEIQAPDGTTYTASDLPSNVSVVADASSSTEVTIGISNPANGDCGLLPEN
jgi:hypothetical protein